MFTYISDTFSTIRHSQKMLQHVFVEIQGFHPHGYVSNLPWLDRRQKPQWKHRKWRRMRPGSESWTSQPKPKSKRCQKWDGTFLQENHANIPRIIYLWTSHCYSLIIRYISTYILQQFWKMDVTGPFILMSLDLFGICRWFRECSIVNCKGRANEMTLEDAEPGRLIPSDHMAMEDVHAFPVETSIYRGGSKCHVCPEIYEFQWLQFWRSWFSWPDGDLKCGVGIWH